MSLTNRDVRRLIITYSVDSIKVKQIYNKGGWPDMKSSKHEFDLRPIIK